MTEVAGKSRVNRPYFFRETDGSRMEVPAFDVGQGDLEGNQLREFNMYVQAGQIEATEPASAPVNLTAPVISGVPEVGETLTVDSEGTWGGTEPIALSVQWQRIAELTWEDIPGEVGDTYALIEDDIDAEIRIVVTATNAAGSASENSNVIGPIVDPEA